MINNILIIYMNKLNIFIINLDSFKKQFIFDNNIIIINISGLCSYKINNNINKINNILKIYDNIININIIFKNINCCNKLITQLHNVLYDYKKKYNIKLFNCYDESKNFMKELYLYKNIVLDPNKNPDTYLKYVLSRVPDNYQFKLFNANKSELFPLTKAVGMGSIYDSYFVHILPKKSLYKRNIYLIGKAITFDTGGLNLKKGDFSDMKIDMIGSAIIMSVINLLHNNNISCNYNIHCIIPIAENMISNNALRPGMVITTLSNKTIEITNTDAEGRLCLVDGFEYVLKYLSHDDDIIIDIATLTGNTEYISSGISSICISNNKASEILNKLIKIGDDIGEYLDQIKIRHEYLDLLKSNVADIKNVSSDASSDCIIAGAFLNFFIDNIISWIHIDLGCGIYPNEKIISYGINLLYTFILQLD